jgi:hypothetical protein
MARSKKAEGAEPFGNYGIRKCQGDIHREEGKSRELRKQSYLQSKSQD